MGNTKTSIINYDSDSVSSVQLQSQSSLGESNGKFSPNGKFDQNGI